MSLTAKTALGLVLALSLSSAVLAAESAEVTAPYLLTDQITSTGTTIAAPPTPAFGTPFAGPTASIQSPSLDYSSGAATGSRYSSSSTYSMASSDSSSSAGAPGHSGHSVMADSGMEYSAGTALAPPMPLNTVPTATPMPGTAPAGTTCAAGVRVQGVPCHGEWVLVQEPPPRLPPPVVEHTYSHAETVAPPVYQQAHIEEISLPGSFFSGGIRYGAGYESTTQYGYGGGGTVFVGGGGRFFSGVTRYTHITPPPAHRPPARKGGGGCGCH